MAMLLHAEIIVNEIVLEKKLVSFDENHRNQTFGKPGRGGNNVGDVSIFRELGGRSKCC